MSLLIANVLFLGPWDLYLFSFRSPNFIFFNYILASSINRLLSTSIFLFSHISYLFKYSYTELEINYFNRPNPVTICSSFSSVASIFSYTYLIPDIYRASNLVQANKSLVHGQVKDVYFGCNKYLYWNIIFISQIHNSIDHINNFFFLKSKRKQPHLSCSLSLLYTASSMKKQTPHLIFNQYESENERGNFDYT